MKTDHLVTAKAVREAFGFPPCVDAYNNSGNELSGDMTGISFEELELCLAQHDALIRAIRANASGGALSPRDDRRLTEAEESYAVLAAELARRPESHQTRAQVEGAGNRGESSGAIKSGGSAGRKVDGHVPQAQRAQSTQDSPRLGLIFNAGERNFSARLFGQQSADPWKGQAEHFFNAIGTRTYDPRLISAATGNEGTGADGGYAVPGQWFGGVIDQALQGAEYAQRCRVFGADANTLTVPLLDVADQTKGVAGLLARWSAEGAMQTAQVLKWVATELKLAKIFVLSEATSELLEDGVSYEQQISSTMSVATAQTLDSGILFGSGVGQPLGIINSTSAIAIAAEGGQTADTVVWENLVKMWTRLTPASRKRATWFVTSSLLPSLMAVKVPGTEAPALLSGGVNDGGAGAPALSIFGRPLICTDINPQAGEIGDIVLVDLTQYALLMKRSARLETDAGPGFASDVLSFRMILRVGGQPMWKKPITPFNGGPTQSWATYLAAR